MGYHGHMQKIADIDILGDKDLQQRVARLSLVIAAVTLVAAVLFGVLAGGEAIGVWWWVALAVGSLVALPVHESFGFQDAFLYTKTDGAVLRRTSMAAVLLAPTVLVSAVVAAAAALAGCPVLAVLLAGLHLSGCAGDVLMAVAAMGEPRCTHVRDTETGITLLSNVLERP